MDNTRIYIVEDSSIIRENLIEALHENAPVEVVGTADDEKSAVAWLRDRSHASDLAAALGHLGNPGEASVQAAIAEVFAAAKSAGKPSGILTPVEADARRYLAMGATFVGVGSDLGVFRGATQQLRDRYAQTG